MPPKKIKKKRTKGFTIMVFGQKKMKGLNKRSIESALLKMVPSLKMKKTDLTVADLCYVVMGNTRETEKTMYAICRKHHLPVALVPSDFEKYGTSAEQMKNGLALKYFQPTKILIAHLKPEEDSTADLLLKQAKRSNIEVTLIPKPEKEAK